MSASNAIPGKLAHPPNRRFRRVWLSLAPLCAAALLVSGHSLPLHAQEQPADNVRRVVRGGTAQVGVTLYYDADYVSLPYPGGDVPAERGVCTDVVVRALRAADVDLQQLVHEDMKKNFSAYPKLWSLKRPDPNIDHRRVPNLMTFFARQGKTLPVTQSAADYLPGDIVAWKLSNGLAHIGLVTDQVSPADPARRLVVHNIGLGARVEDVLFAFQITGHARYFPAR